MAGPSIPTFKTYMLNFIAHFFIFSALTVLTQIGGIAWLMARLFNRRILAFAALYIALSAAAVFVAPIFGRVALSCIGTPGYQLQSPMYCALNRHYVTPELATTLKDVGTKLATLHPSARIRVLDANFPFFNGFPLLPHLSHNDGRKLDIAFFYRDMIGAYRSKSPIGYFAFEKGPTDCPFVWPTLRWNFHWLQPHFPHHTMDRTITKDMITMFAEDPRIGKILLEPHLKTSLSLENDKIRFQGCRAARHDDHIHVQLH